MRLSGRRFRELRMLRGWSQGALAQRAGISRPTVIALEQDRPVRAASIGRVVAALTACPVDPDIAGAVMVDDGDGGLGGAAFEGSG